MLTGISTPVMPVHDDVPAARIGPNAVLQLVGPVARHLGTDLQKNLFASVGYDPLPTGEQMIEEAGVARLHALLGRITDAATACTIATEAGVATADYILANRIPNTAQRVLKFLPSALAATILSKAIAKNAWTFAGSGQFRIVSQHPLILAITQNPLATGEDENSPQCHWHCAVFETLFNTLAGNCWTVYETRCCSMKFKECRFAVVRKSPVKFS